MPGIGAEELTRAVKAFYKPREQNNQPAPADEEDLLFSDAPPNSSTTVDDSLVDAVWEWLGRHPDVEIRTVNDPKATTSQASGSEPLPTTNHVGQRIFTGEDRVWQIISGHGVDYSRIPAKQFDCLSVIAAHGPEGVLQPEVKILTGQDKRSVPHRTDELAAKGYIVKEAVLAKGIKTSLLKLRKFAGAREKEAELQRARAYPERKNLAAEHKIVHYNVWYDETMRLLKENGGIIAYQDIRIGLDIHKKQWETKALRRCVRRLADAGCIRKLKARADGEPGTPSIGNWVRCLQLLREPTESDRMTFMTTKNPEKAARLKAKVAGHSSFMDNDAGDFDEEVESDDDEEEDPEVALLRKRIPPQWRPDLPYTNFVFNIIDNAGPDGISSMDLNARAMGALWRRPLDEIMLRLTDVWQTSQPPHLRHLSIVRDTGMSGKLAHFQYRSFANFEKAVEEGQTMWEAVQSDGNAEKKGKKKAGAVAATAEMDEWGFPKLAASLFAGSEGRAMLWECQELARLDLVRKRPRDSNVSGGFATELTSQAMKGKSSKKTPMFLERTANSPNVEGGFGPALGDSRAPESTPQSTRSKRRKTTSEVVEETVEMRQVVDETTKMLKIMVETIKAATSVPDPGSTPSSSRLAEVEGNAGRELPPERVRELEADILARERPGVYINPPGSMDRRFEDKIGRGRRRKAIIAVFRSARLKEVDWFKEQGAGFAPGSSGPVVQDSSLEQAEAEQGNAIERVEQADGKPRLRRKRKTNADDSESVEQDEAVERGEQVDAERRTRKRRKRRADNPEPEVANGEIPPNPYEATTPVPTALMPPPPPKKRGRPSKADIAERERMRLSLSAVSLTATPPLALTTGGIDTPLDQPLISTPVDSNGTLPRTASTAATFSTPPPGRHSSADQLSSSAAALAQQYSFSPDLWSTPALPTSTPEAVSSTTPTLPPKRGRPTKAMVAERKRLRRDQNTGQTVVDATQPNAVTSEGQDGKSGLMVKFPLPTVLLEQERAKQSSTSVEPATVSAKRTEDVTAHSLLSRIVKLPLPHALRPPRVALAEQHEVTNAEATAGDEPRADDAPADPVDETVSPVTYTRRPSLIAKLPLPQTLQPTPGAATGPETTHEDVSGSTASIVEHSTPENGFVHTETSPTTPESISLHSNAETVHHKMISGNAQQDDGDTARPSRVQEEQEYGVPDAPDLQPNEDVDTPDKDPVEQAQGSALDLSEAIFPSRDVGDAVDDLASRSNRLQELPELVLADVDDKFNYKERSFLKAGTHRHGGILDLQRTNIVMRTVEKAGGVFPGDQELYYPFATAWHKMQNQMPDRNTVNNVVLSLVKQQKLKRYKFHFIDEKSKKQERHIITAPHVDTASPQVQKLQEKIIESWPHRYLPADVDVYKSLRDKACRFFIGHGTGKRKPSEYPEDNDFKYKPSPSKRQRSNADPEWDDFPFDEDLTVRRTDAAVALADVEAQAQGYRNARERRTTILATSQKKFLDKKAALAAQAREKELEYDDSTDDDELDLDELISDGLAALQGDFQLETYHHDPTATPDKEHNGFPTRSLTVGRPMPHLPNRRLASLGGPLAGRVGRPSNIGPRLPNMSGPVGTANPRKTRQKYCGNRHAPLLMQPGHSYHEASGTFGTVGMTIPTNGSSGLASSSMQSESTPRDLQDILERVGPLDCTAFSQPRTLKNLFNREVEQVEAWEMDLVNNRRNLASVYGSTFINHGLNRTLVVSNDPADDLPLAFVAGTLRQAEAENERESQQGRQRKRRTESATTRKSTRKTRGIRKAPASDLVGTFYPGPVLPTQPLLPFSKPLVRSLLDLDPDEPQTLDRAQTPNGVQTASGAGDAMSIPKRTRKPSRAWTYKSQKDKEAAAVDQITLVHTALDLADSDGEFVPSRAPRPAERASNQNPAQIADTQRLATAVALVKALCSGANDSQGIQWEIVAHALDFKYNTKFLQQRWKTQVKSKSGSEFANRLQQALYEPFLAAYENGEVAGIDFENLHQSDWPTLLRWAESKVLPLDQSVRVEDLPSSREAAEREFEITSQAQLEKDSSQDFFINADETSRSQLVAKLPFGIGVPDKSKEAETEPGHDLDQNLILGKSWARAVATTLQAVYDAAKAVQKLGIFDQTTLSKISNEMVQTKTLTQAKKGRQLPGRNYHITDYVLSQFKRWPRDDFLGNVASARTKMVQHFEEHDALELSLDVSEPEMLVLTNMVAAGQLKIVASLPERNEDFKSTIHIPVAYTKTDAFTADHGLRRDVPVPTYAPAILGEQGFRIPFWFDIHGNFLGGVWEMVLSSVLHLVVFRPGSTAKAMERAHKSKLWAWEIELVLGWMEIVGIAERFGPGKVEDEVWKGGLRAGECWYCAFAPEVASWKSHEGAGVDFQ